MKGKKVKDSRKIFCCDFSPTLKVIRNEKGHGEIRIINGNKYEQIGSDMLYCFKTSSIIKLASLN